MTGYEIASTGLGSASVGSGLVGSVLSYISQRKTNQANLNLAKQQNDWNIQQWQRENEYNSPANQLKLLEDAGFNPQTYQQNSTAPNLESADLANQQPRQIDLNTPMQSGLTSLQQAAQAEELRASIKESMQRQRIADTMLPYQVQAADIANGFAMDQRTLADWQSAILRQQYTNERLEAPLRRANLSTQTRATEKGIEATEQNISESQARIAQAWKDLEIKAHLSQWQIKQMQAEIRNINVNTDLLKFRRDMAIKYHIDPNLPALNNLITLALADPSQFSNVANTLRTNVGVLFNEVGNTGDSIGRRLMRANLDPSSPSSWLNPTGFGLRIGLKVHDWLHH